MDAILSIIQGLINWFLNADNETADTIEKGLGGEFYTSMLTAVVEVLKELIDGALAAE